MMWPPSSTPCKNYACMSSEKIREVEEEREDGKKKEKEKREKEKMREEEKVWKVVMTDDVIVKVVWATG